MTLPRLSPLLAVVLLACAGDDSATYGPPTFTVVESADTTFIDWESGAEWPRAPRLRENLRIGEFEGEDHEILGLVSEMIVLSDRSILVFDSQVPILRRYAEDGSYVGQIGREGEGPGEYRGRVRGLGQLPDGRIVLQDMRNHRINVYSAEGESLDSWPASGLHTSQALTIRTDGHLFVKALAVAFIPGVRIPPPWPVGLMHLSPNGEVIDTVPPPTLSDDSEAPPRTWGLHPSGHLVLALGEDYRFEIRRLDGSVIRVTKSYEPVAYSEDEIEAFQAYLSRDGEEPADVAPTKPAIRDFYFGSDGSIWAQRSTRAVPTGSDAPAATPMTSGYANSPFVDPIAFDVFSEDGHFLASLEMPVDFQPLAFSLESLHGLSYGRFDEQYIVRLRVRR